MSVDRNKEIVREAFEALFKGHMGDIADLLADDAVLHQCGFLHAIPARAILQGEFPGPARLADRQVQIERLIGEGDAIALHWRTSGRYTDPGSRRDGMEVSFPSMSFIRLQNGKIMEIWNIQDVATLKSQLDEASAD